MKNKSVFLRILLTLSLLFLISGGLVACGGNSGEHVHVYGEWQTVKEADCTNNGKEARFCTVSNCDDMVTHILPALNHTRNSIDEVVCSRCHQEYYTLGFSFIIDSTKDEYILSGHEAVEDNHLVIPSTYKGKPVSAIAPSAFQNYNKLYSIIIPDTITSIPDNTFNNCKNLYKVTLPSTLESIGSNAFKDCYNIISITLPETLTEIKASAFSGCGKLYEINNLSSLVIVLGKTESVQDSFGGIGYYAKNIYKNEGSKISKDTDGFVFYEDGTTPLLISYQGTESQLVLPEYRNGNAYIVYNHCFINNNRIISITVPNTVVSIGSYAFYNCSSLTTLSLPFRFSPEESDKTDSTRFGYLFYAKGYSDEFFAEYAMRSYNLNGSLSNVTITGGTISEGAFTGCRSIINLVIKADQTTVMARAFTELNKNLKIEGDYSHWDPLWQEDCIIEDIKFI